MASVFKTFLNNDVTSTRTLLHEAIPITGSLVSGTYGGNSVATGSEPNVKTFSHGMFVSVYDYPYLSSSANHLFDISAAYNASSSMSSSTSKQNSKKINMYNQMAQILMGHKTDSSVQEFDEDGDITAGGAKLNEVFFLNFSRLLAKDEIKKGSFSMELGVSSSFSSAFGSILRLNDTNAQNNYRINSPAGEYGILYATMPLSGAAMVLGTGLAPQGLYSRSPGNRPAGLIFYQAGVAVVTASVFAKGSKAANASANPHYQGALYQPAMLWPGQSGAPNAMGKLGDSPYSGSATIDSFLKLKTMDECANAFRHRLNKISFNNTTELNSTVYFCRANHNEFNYSSNPTYLSGSKLRVKNEMSDPPRSYVTTIGLYSADNELLAVAKLSEPLRKDPTNEVTLRVRLDY